MIRLRNGELRIIILLCSVLSASVSTEVQCNYNGFEVNGLCECVAGFSGSFCESCTGRFVLTEKKGNFSNGPIVDSTTPHLSSCIGVVAPDLNENETLFIEFTKVSEGCSNDNLQIRDGLSLQSPLLSSYQGKINAQLGLSYKEKSQSLSKNFLLDFYSNEIVEKLGYILQYSVETCNSSCTEKLTKTEEPTTAITLAELNLYEWKEMGLQGRASFASSFDDNEFYFVFGGEAYGLTLFLEPFIKLNAKELTWEKVNSRNEIQSRSFHSMIYYHDKSSLVVYGGKLEDGSVTNEMWSYSTSEERWQKLQLNNQSDITPRLMMHTAHYVEHNKSMIVLFGYNPEIEASSTLYRLNLINSKWEKIEVNGYRPQGTFGHASVLDDLTGRIYVHGGYLNEESFKYFDTLSLKWTILPDSPIRRFLHTTSLVGNSLYVFGGKLCSENQDFDCSCDNFRYILDQNIWEKIESPILKETSQRFGHVPLTNSSSSDKILLFGGYSNIMLSNMIEYKPTDAIDCSPFNETECTEENKCFWTGETCLHNNQEKCEFICSQLKTCDECFASFCNCCYDNLVTEQPCYVATENTTCKASNCSAENIFCDFHKECNSCLEDGCSWVDDECILYVNGTSKDQMCKPTCGSMNNCSSCLDSVGCLWCDVTDTCMNELMTQLLDPYMKCQQVNGVYTEVCDVTNSTNKECGENQSCDQCHQDKNCGWCVVDGATGVGNCVAGSFSNSDFCDDDDWRWQTCPACQCNGHSNCNGGNSTQCAPCDEGYTGDKCQVCDALYFGSAINGNKCKPCECNNHAKVCSNLGNCNCQVFGMIGRNCDKCNTDIKFFGDPVNDTCYYSMNKVNQQYVFEGDLMKVPQLNFDICLPNNDPIGFGIQVRNNFPANVTIKVNSTSELDNSTDYMFIVNQTLGITLSSDVLNKQYGNPCVRIMFDDVLGASYISVTVTQNSFLLLKIILGLSVGAIVVLLMGLGFYKIKRYREVQQFLQFEIEQQEERANRPMSFINLILNKYKDDLLINKKEEVTPVIAQETLSSNKRAFVTVVLKLPGESDSESGQLAIGSAYVKVDPQFVEEIGSTEDLEVEKKAKPKLVYRFLRPILGRNRSQRNEIASRSSFVNNALDLQNDNNTLEVEPPSHDL